MNVIDLKSPTIPVVFEDDDLLVVDKPSGVLSSPGKSMDNSVLTRALHSDHNVTGPALVHRLDMDTSGLMLIAKNRQIHRQLQQQFEKRKVRKRYYARLSSPPQVLGGRIHLPIRLDIDNRPTQVVCAQHGKTSTTLWHRCRAGDACDIALYPLTGRTHQLRVHTSATQGLGIPIVGDRLYGTKLSDTSSKSTAGNGCYDRLMLHADFLQFVQPRTQQIISVSSLVPF